MCRWLAYSGPAIYLDTLLFEPENSLIEQSLHARKSASVINGDGFGLGWHSGRSRPGLYRDVLPAWNDSNLKSLSHQIKSPMFFAHVRASTGTPISRENCHPFSYKEWLFMHNGQIGNYDLVRRSLEMTLDDKLFPLRHGSTDSELIFLLLIQNGLEDEPHYALRKTISLIIETMKEHKCSEPLRFTSCLSNGSTTIAVRYASDDHAPSLFFMKDEGKILIASEPIDSDREHWRPLPQSKCISVENDTLETRVFSY